MRREEAIAAARSTASASNVSAAISGQSEKTRMLSADIRELTSSTNAYTQALEIAESRIAMQGSGFDSLISSFRDLEQSIQDERNQLGLSQGERNIYATTTAALRDIEQERADSLQEVVNNERLLAVADEELARATDDLAEARTRLTLAQDAYNSAAANDASGEQLRLLKETFEEEQKRYNQQLQLAQAIRDARDEQQVSLDLSREQAEALEDSAIAQQVAIGFFAGRARQEQAITDLYKEQAEAIAAAAEEEKRRADAIRGDSQRAFESFFNSIIRGTESASDAFRALGRAILESVLQQLIVSPLANIFANAIGNILPGGTPQRQGGGPVSPQSAYIVGERGPELLFTGNASGRVVNNSETERMLGGGPSFVFNIEAGVNAEQVREVLVTEAVPLIERRVVSRLELDTSRDSAFSRRFGQF